jgi:UDP-N-acetylmuramate dehydrogenase
MMITALQKILQEAKDNGQLKGALQFNEPLSRYTTWRIGGEAECFYQPENEIDLQRVLKVLPQDTAIFWIGLGSNLLVRDGGVKGLIIYTNGVLNKLEIDCLDSEEKTECIITAQAGVACAIFARKAANNNINGAEFLSGIPGTMGGALVMNAGAFGGETWRHVVNVKMINQQGEIFSRTPDDFNVKYRHVDFKENTSSERVGQEWFLSGTFRFEKDEQGLKQSKQAIKKLLTRRAETQPTKQANAGSVFKNPENDYAARLIEACGLKGLSINNAQISPKHANFIINNGHAQAKDVEVLIDKIKETVLEQCGIKLETEVRIIGQSLENLNK